MLKIVVLYKKCWYIYIYIYIYSKVSVLVTNEKALIKSMIEMNENCDVQRKRKIDKFGKFILSNVSFWIKLFCIYVWEKNIVFIYDH